MINLYNNIISAIDGLFQPLFYLLSVWVPTVDLEGAFDGVLIVMQWVAFMHNPDLFPLFLVVTIDIFILSFLAGVVMSFLRWLIDVIPFV